MKVILLAATGGNQPTCFPFWLRKPKHLYNIQGQVQLERLMSQLFEAGFMQDDIEIVVGFQYQQIIQFLKDKNYNIKVKINHHWRKSAAYTLQVAMEGIDEDFFLFCADDRLATDFFQFIKRDDNKIYFKSTGIKLFREHIQLVKNVASEYLNKKMITNENNYFTSSNVNHTESTHTGVGLSYMLAKVFENIEDKYSNKENFDGFCKGDCDTVYGTDEYKNGSTNFRFAVQISVSCACLIFRFIYFLSKALSYCRAKYYWYLGYNAFEINRFFNKITNFLSRDKNIYLANNGRTLVSEVIITKKLVYLPLAKCGNTSIKLILLNSYGPKGCTIKHYKFLKHDKYKEMYKFTVVRNPYTRLVSSYVYLKKHAENANIQLAKLHSNVGNPYCDFKTFIGLITKLPASKRDEHYAPLSDLLLKNDQFIIDFDKVMKLENLTEELRTLRDRFGIECYEHVNQTEKVNYKDFYDMETFLLVKEYAKKDIDLLGYKREEEELYKYITQSR